MENNARDCSTQMYYCMSAFPALTRLSKEEGKFKVRSAHNTSPNPGHFRLYEGGLPAFPDS